MAKTIVATLEKIFGATPGRSIRQDCVPITLLRNIDLGQACTTYGPWTKCGPRKLFIWPAKNTFLFFHLVCLIETLYERVKNIIMGT